MTLQLLFKPSINAAPPLFIKTNQRGTLSNICSFVGNWMAVGALTQFEQMDDAQEAADIL